MLLYLILIGTGFLGQCCSLVYPVSFCFSCKVSVGHSSQVRSMYGKLPRLCFSGSISPLSFLKGSFAGYKILDCQSPTTNSLNLASYCLLESIICFDYLPFSFLATSVHGVFLVLLLLEICVYSHHPQI